MRKHPLRSVVFNRSRKKLEVYVRPDGVNFPASFPPIIAFITRSSEYIAFARTPLHAKLTNAKVFAAFLWTMTSARECIYRLYLRFHHIALWHNVHLSGVQN